MSANRGRAAERAGHVKLAPPPRQAPGGGGAAKAKRRTRTAPPPAPAAEEEEALGAATVSERTAEVERVEDLVARIAEALGLDPDVEVVEEAGQIRAVLHKVGSRPLPSATRPDDRRRPAPGVQVAAQSGHPRPRAWRWTRPATASAAGLRTGAPGRPGRRRRRARARRPVALDAMSANERKVVHEYLKDRGDVETYSEGHRAGPPGLRRGAARLIWGSVCQVRSGGRARWWVVLVVLWVGFSGRVAAARRLICLIFAGWVPLDRCSSLADRLMIERAPAGGVLTVQSSAMVRDGATRRDSPAGFSEPGVRVG